MVKRGKIILSLMLGIFLLSLTSAVSCNVSTISQTFVYGDPSQVIFTCSNPENYSAPITPYGETSYFSISPDSIPSGATSSMTLTFNSNSPVGLHSGFLNINSTIIPLSFLVDEPSTSSPSTCSINIFPTTLTNIKITQGETKTRTITLSVPSCFQSSVTIQGISLQTDQKPIILGEVSAGVLNPGQSINIPVELNANEVSIGQYNDLLQFLLYNSSGNIITVPNTNIGVLVSQGVTPISNFSTTEIPTCSLNSINLNLNQTYSFTCSIANPNIKIEPFFDNNYLVGVSDASTTIQYVYNFRAKKIGTTSFEAKFYYEGSNGKSLIGEPFSQQVKITNTGNLILEGTNLDLIFYQDGILKTKDQLQAKETVIQAIDNKSGNLVSNYNIQIGGLTLENNTISLEAGKSYNLRVVAPGFNDLITTLTASQVPVPFGVYPSKNVYDVGDMLVLNSSVIGTSFLIGNSIIVSPYILNSPGEFIITARNPSYADNTINITVSKSVFSITGAATWQKGEDVEIELNKESSWEVYFTKENSTTSELINSGMGKKVSFNTRKAGLYEVKADGIIVETKQVVGDKYPYWKKGLFVLGCIVVLIVLFLVFKRRPNNSVSVPYGPQSPFSGQFEGEGH